MNPAAMVALIDYREIDGEERPVNTTVVAIRLNFLFQVIMFFKHGLEEEKV